jgi:predicted glycosyl hydrolase (DUF1957 family)
MTMEELNKQLLVDKFNKVLDRAEEITQWEEFKTYKIKEQELIESSKKENAELIKPYIDKLWNKIEFGNTLDSTALMIALAGNNCMY